MAYDKKKQMAEWYQRTKVERRAFNNNRRKEYYAKNKIKVLSAMKSYYVDNRERFKAYLLNKKYGMSLELYNAMVIIQGGKCAICDKLKPLFVDHCHSSHKVRALLCNNCNRAIGMFYESPEVMQRAIDYLTILNPLKNKTEAVK